MYKILITLLFVATLNAKVVGGVAVLVEGEAITIGDVSKEMRISNLVATKATDKIIREKLEEIEIKKRGLSVASSEVYADIKKTAKQNNITVNEFYESALNANGLNSSEIKEQVKKSLERKKLYSAIAYSNIDTPNQEELEDYYNLHKESFSHPSAFSVVIYQAKDKNLLQTKVSNPMFFSPQVASSEQVLPYDRISPDLAKMLEKTSISSFTPVVPDGKGGFMSLYVKEIQKAKESGFEARKVQITNLIMGQKREQVLSDYFARLRINADINILRMPK